MSSPSYPRPAASPPALAPRAVNPSSGSVPFVAVTGPAARAPASIASLPPELLERVFEFVWVGVAAGDTPCMRSKAVLQTARAAARVVGDDEGNRRRVVSLVLRGARMRTEVISRLAARLVNITELRLWDFPAADRPVDLLSIAALFPHLSYLHLSNVPVVASGLSVFRALRLLYVQTVCLDGLEHAFTPSAFPRLQAFGCHGLYTRTLGVRRAARPPLDPTLRARLGVVQLRSRDWAALPPSWMHPPSGHPSPGAALYVLKQAHVGSLGGVSPQDLDGFMYFLVEDGSAAAVRVALRALARLIRWRAENLVASPPGQVFYLPPRALNAGSDYQRVVDAAAVVGTEIFATSWRAGTDGLCDAFLVARGLAL
ncbi:hypothetical protein JCM10213v2_004656 [Rhodosporidiobolus nylandii]